MVFIGIFFSLGVYVVCTIAKYYSRNSRSVSSESKFARILSFTLCLHQIWSWAKFKVCLHLLYCTVLGLVSRQMSVHRIFVRFGTYICTLSILADQQRPCIVYEPKCGGWGGPALGSGCRIVCPLFDPLSNWAAVPLLYETSEVLNFSFSQFFTYLKRWHRTMCTSMLPLTSNRSCRIWPVSKKAEFHVVTCTQSCKWNERSLNRGLNRGRGLGSDETFFWASCLNLEIDENFRISHKLGLVLAAKISQAFPIQLDRYRGQYTPRPRPTPQ